MLHFGLQEYEKLKFWFPFIFFKPCNDRSSVLVDNKATCCTDICYYFQQSAASTVEKPPAHLSAPMHSRQFQLAITHLNNQLIHYLKDIYDQSERDCDWSQIFTFSFVS